MKRKTTRQVQDARTIRALASPLRMEIVQALPPDEPLTVRELARRLGKPRGSLYYHVRQLLETGVLVEVEQQLRGRRYESLYAVAADRIAVAADPDSEAGRRAAEKLVLSMLRQTGREFQRAMETRAYAEKEIPSGRRQRAWLTPADLRQIEKHLAGIERICSRRKAGGDAELFAVTSLVVPLDDATDEETGD